MNNFATGNLPIDKSVLLTKNTILDHKNANELVVKIFDDFYNPSIEIKGKNIGITLFDEIDFSEIGLDRKKTDDSIFINQFEHIQSLMMSASGFILGMKSKVKRIVDNNKNFLQITDKEEMVIMINKLANVLSKALTKHLDDYEIKMGSSLKLDLLRTFGIPIKDEKFTITIEVDGETVTV
ncbi:MAG: hypothetical protein B6I28_00450 [Fusobacteriia bacterium 4572_132]|nr:MAG: hypothetical protein B6I28_00450 [Fusobacteriia bacterium 4572_132]